MKLLEEKIVESAGEIENGKGEVERRKKTVEDATKSNSLRCKKEAKKKKKHSKAGRLRGDHISGMKRESRYKSQSDGEVVDLSVTSKAQVGRG